MTERAAPSLDQNNKQDSTQRNAERVRNSAIGKTLTHSQFVDGYSIAKMIHTNIRKTGTFKDKLTDHAHAFARQERFDALKGEQIIRDVFIERYGQSMNELREEFLTREEDLFDQAHDFALEHAEKIGPMIRQGETMPFYLAYDRAAHLMGKRLSITENTAKDWMKHAFEKAHGKDLYETCKQVEKDYHYPVKEQERERRQSMRTQETTRARRYS